MGTDDADQAHGLQYNYSFKVHRSLCVELLKLVDKITRVFPEIEAARPRCSSGIQALCLLNGTIDKAKQILQYCCESSKLYLVITGDVIVSRCERVRNHLEQSLGQIQSMVPTMLASKISHMIDDANATTFMMDSSDEEAGKVMRELIQHGTSASVSVEYAEMKALQVAASRLHITSQKAILIERRSIKKLLDKVADNDPIKRKILRYLLILLKKYGNSILEEQTENPRALHEGLDASVDSSNSSVNNLPVVGPDIGHEQDEAQAGIMSRGVPPEEFKCPISMRLMYDPVIIESGQTFERIWIEKWFNEGNDTCPKTKVKLADRSLIPNMGMKDLISKWCKKYEVTIADPSLQNFASFDVSSTSMASLGISMNDLHLPVDVSTISIGSLDSSYTSESSYLKVADRDSGLMSIEKTDDCLKVQPSAYIHETDSEFLNGISELDWDSQCKRVEKFTSQLQHINQACPSLSSENFVEPLLTFLRYAREQHDVTAQRTGCQLLLAFVSRNRRGILDLHEDAFSLLVSLLNTELIEESLAILELSSSEPCCRSKIAACGALAPILSILESQSRECRELAVNILHNLSLSSDICPQIVSLGCIPKLVPLINDGSTARHCIVLLKNLCGTEEAKVAVAETNGCIASIAEVLETGSPEEQEHAVSVLLSLCTQRVQYCQLVMEVGIIPSLCLISMNGNDKGKASATELLRQLRDIDFSGDKESSESDVDTSRDARQQEAAREKKASRTSGFFSKNFFVFSKPGSVGPKKKR